MKEVGKVSMRELKEYFGFEQLTGNEQSLDRWAVIPDINRPGFELAGYCKLTEPRRIVIIGEKECEYIRTLPENVQRERFHNITDAYTPCIVISHGQECPRILRELAQERNFPIFFTTQPTYRTMTDIISFLDYRMAPIELVHGELVSVYGIGVLLLGESGIGKSETTLELVKKGHCLIADDCVEVKRVHNTLIGQAPELLKDMLEVRGVGVVNLAMMYGINAVLDSSEIKLAVKLVKYEENTDYDRIGGSERETMEILEEKIPMITIPVTSGRNIGVLIETAVTDYLLRKRGYNSAKIFEDTLYNRLKEESDKKR